MSHGAIHRCSEVRTAERGAQLAGAWNRYARSGCGAVASVRDLTATGLSLPAGSRDDRPPGARRRAIGADHAQDTGQYRRRGASIFGDQRLDTRRDRHAGDHGFSDRRTRAWLTGGRVRIDIKSSLITHLIVCSVASFSKSTSGWSPTRCGLLARVQR